MNRKVLIWALYFIASSLPVFAEDHFDSLVTTDGKTYTGVTVKEVTPSGLDIIFDAGAATIPFDKLSKELQAKYGYDPAKAAAFERQQVDDRAADDAAIRKQQAIKSGLLGANYDKFKDFTTITGEKLNDEGLNICPICFCKGRSLTAETFHVRFSRTSRDWQYLKYSNLIIIADGIRIDFGSLKHDGDVGNGYVYEELWARCSLNDFKTLAYAKSVEGRLGGDTFSLSFKERASYRAMLEALDLAQAR